MSSGRRGVLIGTPSGAQIPLGQVARISFSRGPALIRDEDGALTGYIYIDLKNTDYGGFVTQADKLLHDKLKLPANSFHWSGEYELELRAKKRLQLILPIVFFVIFLLLYLVFQRSFSFSGAVLGLFSRAYRALTSLVRVHFSNSRDLPTLWGKHRDWAQTLRDVPGSWVASAKHAYGNAAGR